MVLVVRGRGGGAPYFYHEAGIRAELLDDRVWVRLRLLVLLAVTTRGWKTTTQSSVTVHVAKDGAPPRSSKVTDLLVAPAAVTEPPKTVSQSAAALAASSLGRFGSGWPSVNDMP